MARIIPSMPVVGTCANSRILPSWHQQSEARQDEIIHPDIIRVLVCGGRDYGDYNRVAKELDHICFEFDLWKLNEACGAQCPNRLTIIHGHARGADAMADRWAMENNVPVMRYPAQWDRDGKAAGPLRNQRMLNDGKPDLVVAFPGGRGTADMVRRAKKAGVRVIEVTDE